MKRLRKRGKLSDLGYRVRAAIEAFQCPPHDELRINGIHAARFAKRAYGLGDDLQGPGNYDPKDPTQAGLRRVRDWIRMAEHDALQSRRGTTKD